MIKVINGKPQKEEGLRLEDILQGELFSVNGNVFMRVIIKPCYLKPSVKDKVYVIHVMIGLVQTMSPTTIVKRLTGSLTVELNMERV